MCSFASLHFGLRQRVGATTELYADVLNKHWSKGKETIIRDKESDQELVPSYGSIKTSKPITCAKDFQWIPLLLYTKEEGSREQTRSKAKSHNGGLRFCTLNTDQCKLSNSKMFHNKVYVAVSGDNILMKILYQLNVVRECSVCWQSVSNFKCFFLPLLLAHSQNTITIHIDFWTESGSDDTTQGILQFLSYTVI